MSFLKKINIKSGLEQAFWVAVGVVVFVPLVQTGYAKIKNLLGM